ncbi:MAG: 30S ribosomal protein S8 [Candidatus Actinomarinales bacterium]|nr:MAG: 30S ribosomal protein S8 [Candidatus Actinomarinales bacterium]|tara:strand:- start:868 stop:1266 length:399 start_codon:yes stop_codon:yes gene_type:complete
MHSDPISDFLTRIRNAASVAKDYVSIPHSRLKERLANLLVDEGYLLSYKVKEDNQKKELVIELKYTEEGSPVLAGMQRISKPGKRVYMESNGIPRSMGGLGTVVVSTSRGLLSDSDARRRKLGGEIICEVWS